MDEYAPYTPKFTKHGFEKLKIPKKLYQHFRKKLEKNDKPENWEPEMTLAPGTINNRVGVEVSNNFNKRKLDNIIFFILGFTKWKTCRCCISSNSTVVGGQ